VKTKRCSKCGEVKPVSEFYKQKGGKYGVCSQCKECRKKYRKENVGRRTQYLREYYEKNKDKLKKKAEEYLKVNRARAKKYQREYYKNNTEKIIEYQHEYYKNNIEEVRECKRLYYKNNRERIRIRHNKYYKENSDKFKIYYEINSKKILVKRKLRYKNNTEKVKEINNKSMRKLRLIPKNRLSCGISNAIRKSLTINKNGRHWENLVNFTLQDLKTHLEKQFKDDMTWENYGQYGWHIDHIKPIVSFNFESYNDPEFKQCWSLENLQPLWWWENLSKGSNVA